MNVLSKLLEGQGLDGTQPQLPPDDVLSALTISFIPDANPGGTERAPVPWWDGTQYTNEEFWVWMRGRDPRTGKMWGRYDIWDIRQVDPKPETIGIVYERISEHEYVEPNRHHKSSLFKLIFRALERREYALFVSLHQTEFVGSMHDCMAILPITFQEQPEELRQAEQELAGHILESWRGLGGNPVPEIKPLGYTDVQADYLRRAWGEIHRSIACVTTEVRNNSLLCPPSKQRALCEAAIWAAISWALERL